MHIANAKGMRMQVLVPRFQVPVPPWLQVQQSKAQVGEFCSNTYEFFPYILILILNQNKSHQKR